MAAPLLCLIASPSRSGVRSFTEDFSTFLFRDAVYTTADWDTAAGEIKLFPFTPSIIGNSSGWGDAGDLAVAGDHVFIAAGSAGLIIVDISDPSSPSQVGTYPTTAKVTYVTLHGRHAYISDGTNDVVILDITDPTSPSFVGSYSAANTSRGIAVRGNVAYVAWGGDGIIALDVSNPASPALLDSYDTPGFAYDVAVDGDHLFVGDGSSGLLILRIHDADTLSYASGENTPGTAQEIIVSGDYAYLADRSGGVRVIDISDLSNPAPAGSLTVADDARGIDVAGDLLFVADDNAGLQVVDIRDPLNPVIANTILTPGPAVSARWDGELVFVGDGSSGLQVIDFARPMRPLLWGETTSAIDDALEVEVQGNYAYVIDYGSLGGTGSGLEIFDVSDPMDPLHVRSLGPDFELLAISGNYLFTQIYDAPYTYLYSWDISAPSSPTFADLVMTTDGPARSLEAAGNLLLAPASDSLYIYEISEIGTLERRRGFPCSGSSYWDVAFHGDYAYAVQNLPNQLHVIDISNLGSPSLVWTRALSGYPSSIQIHGDLVFVVAGGLEIFGTDNSISPGSSYHSFGPTLRDVRAAGNYVFLSGSYLQVIDVGDPANPVLVETYDELGQGKALDLSGEFAYVAAGSEGLQAYRVLVNEFDAPHRARSIELDGKDETIARVLYSASSTGTIRWEISGDPSGLPDWTPLTSEYQWTRLGTPGSDLVWRAFHISEVGGVNPTATLLDLRWLIEGPTIDLVEDVPDDQGGWVRVRFTRSGYDFADETEAPIQGYVVWKRLEAAAMAAVHEQGARVEPAAELALAQSLPLIGWDGRIFHRAGDGSPRGLGAHGLGEDEIRMDAPAANLPPGTWEVLGSFNAIQEDEYIYLSPTTADSSYSVFVVTAHTPTPSVWFASAPDSGQSIDNIAPGAPSGFAVAYSTGSGNQLTWDPAPEPDFQYYKIYRSTDPGFTPGPSNLVHANATPSWLDPIADGWMYSYKISAVDDAGNESDPSSPGTSTEAEMLPVPEAYALYANNPNPFNPATRIAYDVPSPGGYVSLVVYDVKGRRVATLVDGWAGPGRKSAVWDGKEDGGRAAASGIYFYRMETEGFSETRKMVLLK